jgi:hypothetical protein
MALAVAVSLTLGVGDASAQRTTHAKEPFSTLDIYTSPVEHPFREQVVTRNAAQTHLLVREMIISGTSRCLIRCLMHGLVVDRKSAGTTRFR